MRLSTGSGLADAPGRLAAQAAASAATAQKFRLFMAVVLEVS
jgi:hypothetical protein